MARIFLSYAHEDQPTAKRIVDALAREGFEAWWDHEIPPGRSWDDVIGGRIAQAAVVIVVWSARSISSNFVKEEAQLAFDAGKLLPVKVEEIEPPVGFRRVHAANLAGWRGEAQHRQWMALVNEVRARLGGETGPPPALPQPAPPRTPFKIPRAAIAAAALIAVAAAAGLFLLNHDWTRPAPQGPVETAIADGVPAETAPPEAPAQAETEAPAPTESAAAAAPQIDLPAAPIPSVANSVWAGTIGGSDGEFHIFADGTAEWYYKDEPDTVAPTYTWTQAGAHVRLFDPTGENYEGEVSGGAFFGLATAPGNEDGYSFVLYRQ